MRYNMIERERMTDEMERAAWCGETDSEDRSEEYRNQELRQAYLAGREKRKAQK